MGDLHSFRKVLATLRSAERVCAIGLKRDHPIWSGFSLADFGHVTGGTEVHTHTLTHTH